MNRRSFFTAVAAAASANSPAMNMPEHTESSSTTRKPVEVDLADPDSAAYRRDESVDLFVRLEELYPGDPGQLSGAVLRIMGSDRDARLVAEIGDVLQPYGGTAPHCLGYLDVPDLRQLAVEGANERGFVDLWELYPEMRSGTFWLSGATLNFSGGNVPDIQLCFGEHCLGVLRGKLLTAFLECARIRTGLGVE